MAPAALPVLLSSPCALQKEGYKPETAERPVVVAMFNVAMVGHVNPTLALVQELRRRGCEVHYFLPPSESIRAAAQEAGAVVEGYAAGDPSDLDLEALAADQTDPFDKMSVWPIASILEHGEHIIKRCKELGVGAAVYDPIVPHALLVAHALKVPAVSLVTYPGLGCLAGMMDDAERTARFAKLRQPLCEGVLARFGLDLKGSLDSRVQWLSQDANLVTTSEALVTPLPQGPQWAEEIRASFPEVAVGCMASEAAPHITSSAGKKAMSTGACGLGNDFPADELTAAEARGDRIVYAAMGTMAVSDRWAIDISSSGSGLPEGTTGKAFCQHVWAQLFAAMRELGSGYHCVLGIGCQQDALDFLGDAGLAQVPSNVTLRTTVQQPRMLGRHAHVFVTHAGFNSLQESLVAGVPMVALPQAVDQPANAQRIEAEGWGRAFNKPLEMKAEELAAALRAVAAADGPEQTAARAAGTELRGGEARAAELIMELAKH